MSGFSVLHFVVETNAPACLPRLLEQTAAPAPGASGPLWMRGLRDALEQLLPNMQTGRAVQGRQVASGKRAAQDASRTRGVQERRRPAFARAQAVTVREAAGHFRL